MQHDHGMDLDQFPTEQREQQLDRKDPAEPTS